MGRPLAKPGELSSRIEAMGGIDWVCDQIRQGETIRKMAEKCGVTWNAMWQYTSRDPQRLAATREAQVASGERFTEMAVEQIETIPDVAPAATVARQRELASHYRWMASKRDPRRFGDKLDITATVTEKPDPALLDAKLGAILGQVIRPSIPAPAPAVDDILDLDYTEITHETAATLADTGSAGA